MGSIQRRVCGVEDDAAGGELLEPGVDLLGQEAESVTDLEVGDATLCHESANLVDSDLQPFSQLADVEERLDL